MALIIKKYDELPKSCKDCPFAGVIVRKYGTVERKCIFTGVYVTSETERRDYFCPLDTVPDELLETLDAYKKCVEEFSKEE